MAENTNVVDDTYPVHVEIVYPQRSSRLQALLALAVLPKLLLLIPRSVVVGGSVPPSRGSCCLFADIDHR